jgi:hypothetical protein
LSIARAFGEEKREVTRGYSKLKIFYSIPSPFFLPLLLFSILPFISYQPLCLVSYVKRPPSPGEGAKLLLKPENTEEVAAVVQYCFEHEIALVPQVISNCTHKLSV